MRQILRFIQPVDASAFDHDATRVMDEAFDTACAELRDSSESVSVRVVIAERIIEAAKRGERDPDALHKIALHGLY